MVHQGSSPPLLALRFAVYRGPSLESLPASSTIFARCAQVLPRLARPSPIREQALPHSARSERCDFPWLFRLRPPVEKTCALPSSKKLIGGWIPLELFPQDAFFLEIRPSRTKIVDMRGVCYGKLDFKKMTWANEEPHRVNLPRRPFQTHISTISVPHAEFSAKKGVTWVASRPTKRQYHERHFTIDENAPSRSSRIP